MTGGQVDVLVVGAGPTGLAPALLPLALKATKARAYVFRTVAELDIGYRRSQLSIDDPRPPRRGLRAGDRLPDAPIIHNGVSSTLHAAVSEPRWHLLLCGPRQPWHEDLERVGRRYRVLTVHRLTDEPEPDALYDPTGTALARLGVPAAQNALLLVRPDGHLGYRAADPDLRSLVAYLDRWLPQPDGNS